jgi:cbb3-type cytochrome oxidase cytochrome c subunit
MNRWTMVLCSMLVGMALSSVAWAAKTPDGKPVFLKYKCNMCHSIEAVQVEKKALPDEGGSASKLKPPDLSSVGLDKKADWIALFMQKKEKLDGELHPKMFRGTSSELKTLTAWLETMKAEKKDKAEKAEVKESKAEEKSETKAEEKAEKSENKSEEKSGDEKAGK